MWPRFKSLRPGVVSGLSLLLVLVLASRVFLWVLWFSSLLKINISKFQFDREFEGHRFISRMTVMFYPCKNKVDFFKIYLVNFILQGYAKYC